MTKTFKSLRDASVGLFIRRAQEFLYCSDEVKQMREFKLTSDKFGTVKVKILVIPDDEFGEKKTEAFSKIY